jgi:tetratricopeptide (TPR) repeat protein
MSKKILGWFLVVFLGLSTHNIYGAVITDSLFIQGNTWFSNKQYDHAIQCYSRIIELGYESPNLYYNLGNAYYKQNKYAHAILNYEKALLLRPGDNDIQQNLALANAHVVDKINVVPDFFMKRWIAAVRDMLGPDQWAHLSILFLTVALLGFTLYKLRGRMFFKKTGFLLGVSALLLTLISTIFMYSRIRSIRDHESAIIMLPDVSAHSSPDAQSTNVFVLHEGTKVTVTDSIQDWKEIRIANGNKGWISSDALAGI